MKKRLTRLCDMNTENNTKTSMYEELASLYANRETT